MGALGRSSVQHDASALTLGDLPQNITSQEEKARSQNLEEEAHKLNSALTRLRDTPDIVTNSSPMVVQADFKPGMGLSKPNPATTSHPGLYGLNERDNWLLSKEPMTSAPPRI